MELLQQKLSVYGFKKKQQDLLIRTVKEGNVVQMIILGFAHRERHRISVTISFGVIYKNINCLLYTSFSLNWNNIWPNYTPGITTEIIEWTLPISLHQQNWQSDILPGSNSIGITSLSYPVLSPWIITLMPISTEMEKTKLSIMHSPTLMAMPCIRSAWERIAKSSMSIK